MDTNLYKVNGLVLKEADYKEYDKLLTLFTKELGKIKVYAFGVRKGNSKSIGKTMPFVFCTYELKKDKDMYVLSGSTLLKSFTELSSDYDTACYASYFLELIEYFAVENEESDDMYALIYYTLKALLDKKVKKGLIRRIFELKLLKYQGLYTDTEDIKYEKLKYTWDFVLRTDPKDLYSFKLDTELEKLFFDVISLEMREKVNRKFKSLENIFDES